MESVQHTNGIQCCYQIGQPLTLRLTEVAEFLSCPQFAGRPGKSEGKIRRVAGRIENSAKLDSHDKSNRFAHVGRAGRRIRSFPHWNEGQKTVEVAQMDSHVLSHAENAEGTRSASRIWIFGTHGSRARHRPILALVRTFGSLCAGERQEALACMD